MASSLATQLSRHHKFPQDPVVVVGRVAQASNINVRAVGQNPARVGICAEPPFAVVLAHAGISNAAKWQVVNSRLQGTVYSITLVAFVVIVISLSRQLKVFPRMR